MPGFEIKTTLSEDHHLSIYATSTARTFKCPQCGQVSTQTHGWYARQPQDLPCIGQHVALVLTVRRFRCCNVACAKQTFAERFPDWLPFYAHRTTRLTQLMRRVGFEVSAESGRRILRFMRVRTSGDTLLRIVKGTAMQPHTVGTVLGVDDWAIRKGHRYGTIVVDHKSRQVLELVTGRLPEDIQPWFAAHPEVEVVTRDRSREYGSALDAALPKAEQVADRWHLLLNLRQLAERVIASAYRRLKQFPVPPELRPQRPMYLRSLREQDRRDTSRQRRLDYYNEVQRLKREGLTASQVMMHLGRNYYTVRFFYNALEFPERMPGRAPHSLMTPYLDVLEAHFQAGTVKVGQLYEAIAAKGYKGSKGMVGRWLQSRRLLDGEDPVVAATSLPITDTSSAIPSSLKLAWLMVMPATKLTERDQAMLKHILQDDVVAQCHHLIHRFRKALHDRDPAEFDQWLQTAEKSSLKQIRSFAKSLHDDYAFIRAAFTSPWSNGHTEGQITRLKFIKRQMYGRASFALLRQKVLYQPGST